MKHHYFRYIQWILHLKTTEIVLLWGTTIFPSKGWLSLNQLMLLEGQEYQIIGTIFGPEF